MERNIKADSYEPKPQQESIEVGPSDVPVHPEQVEAEATTSPETLKGIKEALRLRAIPATGAEAFYYQNLHGRE